MCEKEDIVNTFKNKPARLNKNWYNSMKTLLSQVTSQATGVPNGNHGLYFKYGIQAVTLESNSFKKRITNKTNFLSMGRLLEGIFRSLNNLLERFHQSYFFYLLPSPNRFISIGMYISFFITQKKFFNKFFRIVHSYHLHFGCNSVCKIFPSMDSAQ